MKWTLFYQSLAHCPFDVPGSTWCYCFDVCGSTWRSTASIYVVLYGSTASIYVVLHGSTASMYVVLLGPCQGKMTYISLANGRLVSS